MKKTGLSLIFATHFSLFGYLADETLFVVFDILLLNSCYKKLIHGLFFHLVTFLSSKQLLLRFFKDKAGYSCLVFGKEDLG